ncbi:hypothetical protein LCGC14_1812290, partial [marine sediment metagenome]
QWALFSFDFLCIIFAGLFVIQAKKIRTRAQPKAQQQSSRRAAKTNLQEQS